MSNTRSVPLRTAALCACLLSSALLTGCGGGSSSTPTTTIAPTTNADGSVTSAPRTYNNLQFTLTTNKAVYARGETVQFTLAVKNIGSQTISTTFYGAEAGSKVLQGNTVIYPGPVVGGMGVAGSSAGTNNSSTQGNADTSTIAFAPGETKTYADIWTQLNMQSMQVAPGKYRIIHWYKANVIDDPSLPGTQAHTQLSDTQQQTLLTAYPLDVTVQ